MREGELVVRGYREFLRAADRAGKDAKREVRSIYREVGEIVRVEATRLFSPINVESAEAYRVSVRQRGVEVDSTKRKTTGKRPDWGARQMRDALLPALHRKEGEVEAAFEHAADLVADVFEYSSY